MTEKSTHRNGDPVDDADARAIDDADSKVLAGSSLNGADLRVARAAAAARAQVLRRAADATRTAGTSRDAGQAPRAAGDGSRRIALLPRTLLIGALAVALVAGLVGGFGAWLLSGAAALGGVPSASLSAEPGSEEAVLRRAAERAAASVVSLRISAAARSEVGSAIVLSDDGLVLTNAHVITLDGTVDDAVVTATAADGRIFATSLVGLDPLADLAVLQLEGAEQLAPASWDTSESLHVGQTTLVLGTPLGLSGTVTRGIVSTVHRSIQIVSSAAPDSDDADVDPGTQPGPTPQPAAPGASTVYLGVFQTDAAINPGNSGGPVVNLDGEVIGVSVAIATTATGATPAAEGSIGLGFAIPAHVARRVAQALAAGETPSHGALGASVMAAANVAGDGEPITGAYIDAASAGGAAERSGLQHGDIVTAVDGIPVAGPSDLLAWVRSYPGGQRVELTVVRDDEPINVELVLDHAA